MGTKKFSHVSIQDTNSIRLYLHSLIEALERKKITLTSGDDKMDMNVSELCRISIQAKSKDSENKIAIKLSWTEAEKTPELSETKVEIS